MKKALIAALAALPLLFTSCATDPLGSGWGEHNRWHADGHIQSSFYGRKYYFDPNSLHDAHARARGPHETPYRVYANEAEGPHGYYLFQGSRYYDPNSIHDAYARPRGRRVVQQPGSGS